MADAKESRDAWLKLVRHLEAELLATREHAKGQDKLEKLAQYPPSPSTWGEWEATAWAAQRLLDALAGLSVPDVPENPAEGQGSLLQELAEQGPYLAGLNISQAMPARDADLGPKPEGRKGGW